MPYHSLQLLAEIAGVPSGFALPISIVSVVVLFLVGLLTAGYRELSAARKEHTDYVKAQLEISRLREAAQEERNEKQAATIAKLTDVAELLTQRANDPRNRGGGLR